MRLVVVCAHLLAGLVCLLLLDGVRVCVCVQ